MTVVLVHGNPESAALWEPLVAELARAGVEDVVRLSPPGFGAPLPAGFPATVAAYRDWLIGELEQLGGPVDLVGHDWGGGHVVTAAIARPDLVRSWVSDILGGFHPDYVWHDLARTWQTPGDGEANLEKMFSGTIEARTERMEGFGVGHTEAVQIAGAQGEEMTRAVLALYRDAAQPAMAEIGADLPDLAKRPGLGIIATEDHFVGSEAQRRETAERAGAEVAVLDGLGHWWMSQDPARAARVLVAFWRARVWG